MRINSIIFFATISSLFTACQAMEPKEQIPSPQKATSVNVEELGLLTLQMITVFKETLEDNITIDTNALETVEKATEQKKFFLGLAYNAYQLASFFTAYQEKCMSLKGFATTAELGFLTSEERVYLAQSMREIHDGFMDKINPESPILEWGNKKYQNNYAKK